MIAGSVHSSKGILQKNYPNCIKPYLIPRLNMGDVPGNPVDDNPNVLNNEMNVEPVRVVDESVPAFRDFVEATQALLAVVDNNNPSPSSDTNLSGFKTVGTQCGSAETVDEENIVVTKKCFSPQPVEIPEVVEMQHEDASNEHEQYVLFFAFPKILAHNAVHIPQTLDEASIAVDRVLE
ncbi:hypothetical protein CBL_03211 [Carabus blaptoides fortunei]